MLIPQTKEKKRVLKFFLHNIKKRYDNVLINIWSTLEYITLLLFLIILASVHNINE